MELDRQLPKRINFSGSLRFEVRYLMVPGHDGARGRVRIVAER